VNQAIHENMGVAGGGFGHYQGEWVEEQ